MFSSLDLLQLFTKKTLYASIYYLGVFIGPSKQDSGNALHLQRLLFDNFRSAVELIHGIFELSGNQRANIASTNSENGSGKWASRSLVALKEHVSFN